VSKRNTPFADVVRAAVEELRAEKAGRIEGGLEAVYALARQNRGPAGVEALELATWKAATVTR